MKKLILLYSLIIAATAWLLQWLEYRYMVRVFSGEIYVALVALAFTGLGIWVGHRLTSGPASSAPGTDRGAIEALRISGREYQVLELLAAGHSNREIAERLFVSPNTVKTHVAHLYDKLEVRRRTQAIAEARKLRILR